MVLGVAWCSWWLGGEKSSVVLLIRFLFGFACHVLDEAEHDRHARRDPVIVRRPFGHRERPPVRDIVQRQQELGTRRGLQKLQELLPVRVPPRLGRLVPRLRQRQLAARGVKVVYIVFSPLER